MQNLPSLNRTSETVVQTTRALIHDESFCHRYRTSDRHFTRRRKLTFVNVMVIYSKKRSVRFNCTCMIFLRGWWRTAGAPPPHPGAKRA